MDDIVEFDPVTKSVTTLEATLSRTVLGTSAATAPNGKIYVFGGNNDGDSVEEFDPVAQTATKLGVTLPGSGYLSAAATALNGKIYVFDGYNDGDIVEFISSVPQYAYSPAVVLSQAEYTQLKNILKGIFEVGISAPSATVEGAITAPSFNATT